MDTHERASLFDLPGLPDWCEAHGFEIEEVAPQEATVTDTKGGSIWSLYQVEAWVQIKGLIFEDTRPTQALCLSLMRLHSRLLGCRFGMDADNNLCLLSDVFPHDQTGEGIGAAVTQMQWIVDNTHGLLRRVQETGIAADEDDIDDAFESDDSPPLH